MNAPPPGPINDTETIARNSFWYGLELALSIVVSLVVSIIVARVIGPTRLGYYNYIMLLTNVTASVGGNGLAVTTRKYMAEYLNRNEGGTARAVYLYALRRQALICIGVTITGLALLFWAGDPAQRIVSAILVMNIAPRMIAYIPSQANAAGEMMKRNTGPALLGGATGMTITLYGLHAGWDLYGMAIGLALGSTVEAVAKLRAVHSWLAPIPRGTIPFELQRRLFSYSGQGLVLVVLSIVVWDRSDLVILKWMNRDIRQVTFFATSFGLTDRLLMLPSAFSAALGATMMAQFGRAEERIRQITVTGAKYALLLALPLLAGVACISRSFIVVAYRQLYEPMIPVLAISTLLAIPKALTAAPTALLQTVEKQGFLIWTGCICGAVDVGLDFLLTPTQGAAGAALANGLAQTLAAVLIWRRVHRDFEVDLRLGEFARIALSGALMSAVVLLVERLAPFSGTARLTCSIAAGSLVWLGALRITGALNETDRERLFHIGRRLPEGMRPIVERCVGLLVAEPLP